MKKSLFPILFACMSVFASCSNGDYVANPTSIANSGVNPITPLTPDEYGAWGGEAPVSATINGKYWKADWAYYSVDSTWSNIITAGKDHQVMYLYLRDVWANNLYNIGYQSDSRFIQWSDSLAGTFVTYYSNLGNSGGLYVTDNDTLGKYSGKFYFNGVSPTGQSVTVSNGYFSVQKW